MEYFQEYVCTFNPDRKGGGGGGDVSRVFIEAVLAEQTLTHSVRAVKTSQKKWVVASVKAADSIRDALR